MYHLPAENIVSYRWQLRCRWKKFQLWSRYSSLDPLSIYYAVAIWSSLTLRARPLIFWPQSIMCRSSCGQTLHQSYMTCHYL